MTRVTFSNYKSVLYHGANIIYGNNSDTRHTGVVHSDPKWNGGFKCAGRSILNLLEEFDNVMIVA